MALNNEDKKDVVRAFGKKVAGQVSNATRDGSKKYGKYQGESGAKLLAKKNDSKSEAKMKAIHAKMGRSDGKYKNTGCAYHGNKNCSRCD